MKRFLFTLLITLGFSSCYVYDEVRVSPHPQTFYYRWDPYYYAPRTVIVVPRRRVVEEKPNPPRIIERQPQRDQRPHRIPTPIRTFPRERH